MVANFDGHRGELFDASLLDDADGLRDYLNDTRKVGTLSGAEVMENWRTHALNLAFETFFFDDLAEPLDAMLRNFLLFLGADPERQSSLSADHNRKAKKLSMTATARAVLVDYFAGEIMASAEVSAERRKTGRQNTGFRSSRRPRQMLPRLRPTSPSLRWKSVSQTAQVNAMGLSKLTSLCRKSVSPTASVAGGRCGHA
jgi:hypothetical protein